MAGDGTPLLRASAFAAAIDGAITFVMADDPVEAPARRCDRLAANRGLAQKELAEDAARGWSSADVERGLTLRRRGGSAASCSRCRDGLGRTAGEERGCRREEAAATAGSLGIGAEAVVAKEPVLDRVAFFCLTVL
ncbi:hypothetical protein BAE44_0010062 [Dichanthelium oligosanthes]|uniref:Uncharacterized protein n=1 Tax=Dichanthelium oligosanthes TaxID=888268 RepID=A0A1E5VUW9_9POAL|nr:hypothetical protein BAE44_0010062 [Dichanthelium oligosanthes]